MEWEVDRTSARYPNKRPMVQHGYAYSIEGVATVQVIDYAVIGEGKPIVKGLLYEIRPQGFICNPFME